MSTLYPATLSSVNPSAVSFYRWLYRWHNETGDVHPSTRYLARKQRRSERTVYRWLADLRAASLIAEEVVQGVERRIVPLVDPGALPGRPGAARRRGASPTPIATGSARSAAGSALEATGESGIGGRRRKGCPPSGQRPQMIDHEGSRKGATEPQQRARSAGDGVGSLPVDRAQMSGVMSGVVSGVMSGVPPITDAYTQETQQTQGSGVVVALAEVGVSAGAAAVLVAEVGAEEARKQLEALPYRRAKDRAAVLVASIRGRWDVPRAYAEVLERKRREAQEVQKRALAASLEEKRAEQRAEAAARLSGLSEAEYRHLEARALADLERSPVWRLARGSGGVAADKLLRAKLLDLLGGQQVAS